jgi:hypothetical protein
MVCCVIRRGFSDKYEAVVGVRDVELGHAVVAVEEVADSVAVLEGLHVLPEHVDVRDFDVDLGVTADAVHNFFGGGFLEVDGLAVAFYDGIPAPSCRV